MKPDEWWKNFSIGVELDVAGAFIFNGIKELDSIENLNQEVDVFEVLYNLSVGIERLLKVSVILIEHNDSVDIEYFEKSLITHSSSALITRVESYRSMNLSGVHNKLISMLDKFYKTHRYGRYSLSSIPSNIDAGKQIFLKFVSENLDITIDYYDESAFIENTDQIKKFVGKTVKKISKELFSIIQKKAHELNIYTDELRGDSKAIWVFYGERLDFIDENMAKRELILFLMNPKSQGGHINLLRSFDCLDLNPVFASSHIKALLNDRHLPYVMDELEEVYTEIENIRERFGMLGVIDNEYLSYGDEIEI